MNTIIEYGSPEYSQMVDLRTRILREPLNLSFSEQDLFRDKEDMLCGYFEKSFLKACCILSRYDTETLQLRQMAVDNTCQGKGIGNILLNFAEQKAKENRFTKIMLHARETAISFYLKNGYQIVSNKFIEVGIPHYEMIKELKNI